MATQEIKVFTKQKLDLIAAKGADKCVIFTVIVALILLAFFGALNARYIQKNDITISEQQRAFLDFRQRQNIEHLSAKQLKQLRQQKLLQKQQRQKQQQQQQQQQSAHGAK